MFVRAARGRFDEFPEFGVLLERLVFGDGKIGAIEKIFERVFAHDAIDEHAELVAFKVDAVIAQAKAVKIAAGAVQAAIFFQIVLHHFVGQAAKFAQDIKLKFLGHLGELGGAGGIENNLERTHWRFGSNW